MEGSGAIGKKQMQEGRSRGRREGAGAGGKELGQEGRSRARS